MTVARRLIGDTLVPIDGTSDRLRGSYYIRAVTHTLTRSEYVQDFQVERPGVQPPPAKAGSAPPLI